MVDHSGRGVRTIVPQWAVCGNVYALRLAILQKIILWVLRVQLYLVYNRNMSRARDECFQVIDCAV